MKITSPDFQRKASKALHDPMLQKALSNIEKGFIAKRIKAAAALPEFEELRDRARDIKDHTLARLDLYLEAFERRVTAAGGEVHWAETPDDARAIIAEICQRVGAKTVTKGKSMISEEIALNEHLESLGLEPVETDLGEYIVQIRGEYPSHIIAPAVHLTKEQVADDFRRVHDHLDVARDLTEPTTLLGEARTVLREKFIAADVGITGANFLVAETGSVVLVTNEGNGDLTQTLPKATIVLATPEKVVPTLEDVDTLLRLLARSATGQDLSVYTTFATGSKRPGDPDGPAEFHVVLLDNGRTAMLGTEFQEMLRCIRCGTCINHCPVYHVLGGHAYGWVYPGPMGAVLTPTLVGIDKAGHLPNASTFCGRCEDVCPMRIPLPRMMRTWRNREFERALNPAVTRFGLRAWAFLAARPFIYRKINRIASMVLSGLAAGRGRIRKLPFAGSWTSVRDMPAPEGGTFQDLWKERRAASTTEPSKEH
jgi:L-lactate dehydrogenase complex protein LldF